MPMIPQARRFAALAVAVLAAAPAPPARADATRDEASAIEFFEKKVRPILVDNCYNCHSASTNAKGGLRVDDRNGLIAGGSGGPAVVPGDPDGSLLIQAVRHEDGLKMPPKKQLAPEQVADLAAWIKAGAAWPAEAAAAEVGKANPAYDKLRAEHWAWQPLREGAPPAVADGAWPRGDIDRFILAALEAKGLAPVGDAARTPWLRRVTFDLTGLPPTPEEVSAFLADGSDQAREKVVDRLLDAPAFGERWGRHWLDVARYGESTGSSRNVPYPQAWRYRDYVIRSFQADKPYDRFVREQVAGDLLPADSPEQKEEQAVATGFLALGVKDVNQRFKVRFDMDNVDEQIDAVSRSVLGLTASCARCHDHKFDPIPTADYYALAGIFRSTDLCAGVRNKMGGGGLDYYDTEKLVRLGPDAAPDPARVAKVAEAKAAYEKAKKEFEAIRGTPEGLKIAANGRPTQQPFRLRMNKLQAEYLALTDPANGNVALGVREGKEVGDTAIRLRGEAEKHGPVVPRGFLSVLRFAEAPKIDPKQSGRLELAGWLTDARNPLTPRVLVNRVWGHLFGKGIVQSVDNFGVMGDRPSHPELLDHLAARFVRDGWSVKRLVREIVLTRAYGLDSATRPENFAVDPAARLVWRHNPRRLEAEELRDAALAAAGRLDRSRPEAPVRELKVIEIRNNGPEAARLKTLAAASPHRSVYLPLLRGVVPTSLEVFDPAEQGMVSGAREATTVAPQALYQLNDPFVRNQALALAENLLARSELADDARVDLAYRRALGRPATPAEVDRARGFVAEVAALVREAGSEPEPASPAPVTVAAADEGGTGNGGGNAGTGEKAPPPPINPDQAVAVEVAVAEEVARPSSPEAAAWASFCQALLGSAEFRYIP